MRAIEEIKRDSYWWCPNCKEEVDPHSVTYQEIHESCGYRVHWVENIPPDRLEQLCQAERDGRCEILPCKVGDKIYNREGKELTVERISIAEHINIYAHTAKCTADGNYNPHWIGYEIKPKAFGKTVFLTRAEAEEPITADTPESQP